MFLMDGSDICAHPCIHIKAVFVSLQFNKIESALNFSSYCDWVIHWNSLDGQQGIYLEGPKKIRLMITLTLLCIWHFPLDSHAMKVIFMC